MKNRRSPKPIAKISYLLYLLLCVVAVDIIYTKFFEKLPSFKTDVYLQMHEFSIYQVSKVAGLFYELKPNSQQGTFKINSWGLREAEPTDRKDRYRILIMGDSVTFGPGKEFSQLFTELTEKRLNIKGKKIEILNAGVCGYNTKQEFIALKEKYLPLHPDLVIFAFCANDLKETAIQYLPTDYVQKKLLRNGTKPTDSYYLNLPQIYYLCLILPNQFFLKRKLDRWLLLHSSIYRTISIIKFKTKNNIKSLKELPDSLLNLDFNLILQKIKKLASINKFSLKFLLLPTTAEYNKEKIILSLNKNKIDSWDFDLLLEEKTENKSIFLEKDGFHLTVKGHLIVSKLLTEELLKLDL